MRGRYLAAVLGGALLLLSACGGPGGGTPVALAPPTDLTASAGDRDVDLAWQPSTADDVVKYNVYRGTTSGGLTEIGDVAGNVLSYRASGLVNDTEYFFAVEAENSDGKKSVKSNVVSATPTAITEHTPPTVRTTSPQDGAAGIGTNVNIVVTFSKPMDELSTEAAFSAEPAIDCSFTWANAGQRLTCAPTGGLDASENYTITIGTGAEDRDGNKLAAAKVFRFETGVGLFTSCTFGASTFDGCTFGP